MGEAILYLEEANWDLLVSVSVTNAAPLNYVSTKSALSSLCLARLCLYGIDRHPTGHSAGGRLAGQWAIITGSSSDSATTSSTDGRCASIVQEVQQLGWWLIVIVILVVQQEPQQQEY